MNAKIKMSFLSEMEPILVDLAGRWFPPDKKSPSGLYYSCTYCDMKDYGHEEHEDSCLYQRAKVTLEKWADIDKDDKWDLDWKNNPRDPKEIEDFRKLYKYYAIFDHFITNAAHFVPMDFSDPRNEGVICSCVMVDEGMEKHSPTCPYLRTSKALLGLYQVTGPRETQIDGKQD
jgi:hypothetical protein